MSVLPPKNHPQIFVRSPHILFLFKSHTKFQNLRTTPSGRKVTRLEREKERRKIIPLALIGVLAPVSAQAGRSAQLPINTSRDFLSHMSEEEKT